MTCPRCAELEAELRILRQVAGAKELRTARLMQCWDVGETPARIALRLYDAQGAISTEDLSACLTKGRSRKAIFTHICHLRKEMDASAIDTLEGAYRLTPVGRAEVERALATPAN